MKTTTEGDWELEPSPEPEPLGPLVPNEAVAGPPGTVTVTGPDGPPLPNPDEPYGVTCGPEDGEAPCDPDPIPEKVIVRTPVDPEGTPGPAGTV